ncbi:hypothetical protein TI05_16815, partial [Achromatium sp. WMS3]
MNSNTGPRLQKDNFHGPWPAPAKLNLMLRVLGQRLDGYHLLQTVFQFINVGDLLYFRIRDDGYIKPTNNLREIPESVDLTVRAAYILQQQTNCPLGVDIYLNKLLPLGSGLG